MVYWSAFRFELQPYKAQDLTMSTAPWPPIFYWRCYCSVADGSIRSSALNTTQTTRSQDRTKHNAQRMPPRRGVAITWAQGHWQSYLKLDQLFKVCLGASRSRDLHPRHHTHTHQATKHYGNTQYLDLAGMPCSAGNIE